jgi:hydrogenase nickel incorporation protein HypA/HybF
VHEFSIAAALADQVVRHAPPDGRVREVEIRVGALRGLDPEALKMCWDAVTHETPLAGSVLVMEMRPWSLACPACRREWESRVPFVTCECGETAPNPTADDELLLIAISIDDEDDAGGPGTAEPAAAAQHGKARN